MTNDFLDIEIPAHWRARIRAAAILVTLAVILSAAAYAYAQMLDRQPAPRPQAGLYTLQNPQ